MLIFPRRLTQAMFLYKSESESFNVTSSAANRKCQVVLCACYRLALLFAVAKSSENWVNLEIYPIVSEAFPVQFFSAGENNLTTISSFALRKKS
jgi:hypothetical protein